MAGVGDTQSDPRIGPAEQHADLSGEVVRHLEGRRRLKRIEENLDAPIRAITAAHQRRTKTVMSDDDMEFFETLFRSSDCQMTSRFDATDG